MGANSQRPPKMDPLNKWRNRPLVLRKFPQRQQCQKRAIRRKRKREVPTSGCLCAGWSTPRRRRESMQSFLSGAKRARKLPNQRKGKRSLLPRVVERQTRRSLPGSPSWTLQMTVQVMMTPSIELTMMRANARKGRKNLERRNRRKSPRSTTVRTMMLSWIKLSMTPAMTFPAMMTSTIELTRICPKAGRGRKKPGKKKPKKKPAFDDSSEDDELINKVVSDNFESGEENAEGTANRSKKVPQQF